MTMRIRLVNASRERPNRYRADLTLDGRKVGIVERGWSQGGRGSYRYVALVNGLTVAMGETLADLRGELAEWIEEEL